MKRTVVGCLAAGLVFAGAGVAVADWGKSIPTLGSDGAEFKDGRYKFNPAETGHGSFEWRGRLKDALPGDGHNVYMQVRVEGHDWVRYYGKEGRTVSLHHHNWDGAQRYTDDAHIRACRDRGSLRPDNCSRTVDYSYRRD